MKTIPNTYRRYRARHIKAGLCVQCSRKPKPGLLRCRVCLERKQKLRMARYPKFCPVCGKLIKPEERQIGKRFHELCAEKRRGTKYPQQHRLASLAYQRRHRELGLCHICSEKAFKWGVCQKHYKIEQEKNYRQRAESRRVN